MSEMQLGLEKIVEILLHKHECVILPEFGGFIVRESPCNFSASGDKLKPYSKHIFFNPHLTLNDGLVYNEIQTQKACTYTEAIEWYNARLNDLKHLIVDSGSSRFGELGTFFPGKENSFWFSPAPDMNLATSSYGLYPLEVHKVVKPESVQETEPVKVIELSTKAVADRKPIESLEPVKMNYKAWLSAAVVALLVHFIYLKVETTDVTTNEASVLPTFPQKQLVDKPSVAIVDTAVTMEADTNTTLEPAVLEPAINTVEPSKVDETEVKEVKPEIAKVEPIVETPVEKVITSAETVDSIIAPKLTRVAKYKMESNALYHKKDLEKKGEKVVIENKDGLFEVFIEQ